MIQCRFCEEWFKNQNTYSNHRLYFCLYHKRLYIVNKKQTIDNNLDMLCDYLNGNIDLLGNKIII